MIYTINTTTDHPPPPLLRASDELYLPREAAEKLFSLPTSASDILEQKPRKSQTLPNTCICREEHTQNLKDENQQRVSSRTGFRKDPLIIIIIIMICLPGPWPGHSGALIHSSCSHVRDSVCPGRCGGHQSCLRWDYNPPGSTLHKRLW